MRKGQKVSEKTKILMSKARIGIKLSLSTRLKMSKAKKGCTPWNKGKKIHYTPPRAFKKGHVPWSTGKKGIFIEDKARHWKGDEVGYRGIHYWVVKKLGKPSECSYCHLRGLQGRKIHWANISGKYKGLLTDWVRLCAKCHGAYDKAHGFRIRRKNI